MIPFCEERVIKLSPPILNPQTIQKQIVCTRPVREGSFNISLETRETKKIIHCYGHGGSGWTTLFGSVAKAIKLFEDDKHNTKGKVRVIGAGCMGLCVAAELALKGYAVVGITAEELYMIYQKGYQEGKPERIYLFPRTSAISEAGQEIPSKGVLDGTFIERTDQLTPNELAQLDQQEFAKLLNRASLFFQGAVALTAR